jgi:hypothetical protein
MIRWTPRTAWLLILLFASPANAQINSGAITGIVRDEKASVVPGAQVVLTNEDTNVSNTVKTLESGQFTFPYLPAGKYSISVKREGFAAYEEKGLALAAIQTLRVDVTLRVSAVQSTIEVVASTAQVQTDSSSVETAISSKVIDAIPNQSQNPLYYAMLQAGASPTTASLDTTSANSFGIGINGRRQFTALGFNGGRAFTNDGQSAISMNTKSGTNQLHGQATYTLRNEALNANTSSNNTNSLARPPFKVDEFGGSAGGHIIRNKLFFATSYHYLMHNVGIANLATVPTAAQRMGDFSQTLIEDENGSPEPAPIFDPFRASYHLSPLSSFSREYVTGFEWILQLPIHAASSDSHVLSGISD